MKEQYLMKEERKLLECLRENYNCKTIYFDGETGEWIILSENTNGMFTRATFDECTFTLNRFMVMDISELLKEVK